MNNYKELKKLCIAFAKGFEDVKALAWDWGNSKKSIKKAMLEIQKSGPDGIAMEYEIQNSYLYLIAEVFQDAKAMKQLRTRHEAELTLEGMQVLSFWEKEPGFWCYFSVKKKMATDFFLILDHMTGKEHTLYSKGISTMQTWQGAEELRYLCMILPNEECLQTVGVIKYYKIPVSDFMFYCSLFKPQSSLKTILSKHFIPFFKLDAIATLPMLYQKGHAMGFVWSSFSLPEFDILQLGGNWFVDTLGTQQKFIFDLPDSTMDKLPNSTLFDTTSRVMSGVILRDSTTGEMGIMTNTEAAYTFFAALVKKAYPELKFSKKPPFSFSAALQAHLIEREFPLPWKKFEEIIEYEPEPGPEGYDDFTIDWEHVRKEFDNLPDDEPFAPQLKGLLGIFLTSQETGEPLDVDALAKVTGMDKEKVELMLKSVEDNPERSPYSWLVDDDDDFFGDMSDEETYEVPPEDKKFEMKNLSMPEDEDGELLYQDLSGSTLFSVNNIQKAEEQLLGMTSEAFAAEIPKYGLLDSIEELFTEEFEELDYPVMNAFFWLLLHNGKKWIPLRSYAIEMLKWFSSLLFEEYESDNDFIYDFSIFVLTVLSPVGICSLEKRPSVASTNTGTYKIKATEAFFSMLKVSEDMALDD